MVISPIPITILTTIALLNYYLRVSEVVVSDNATIVDTILNAHDAPEQGSAEYKTKLTAATNNLRKLVPELKEAQQNTIAKHIQASNRPVDGNGKYISNYITFDDLVSALLTPCQTRAQDFYNRFHKGEGFLTAVETMEMSLASMELSPTKWDPEQVNTFERFLQHAVHQIHNTHK